MRPVVAAAYLRKIRVCAAYAAMRPVIFIFLVITNCNLKIMICFRITKDVVPDNVLNYLISKGLLLLVQEVGEEMGHIHFHGMLDMPRKTLSDFFRKNFEGGNKVWSVKECTDVDGWLRYCCKGTSRGMMPDIRYNVGHDTVSYHNAYWDINKELKKPENRKRKAESVLEEIWEDIKEELGTCVSGRVIASVIFRWYMRK